MVSNVSFCQAQVFYYIGDGHHGHAKDAAKLVLGQKVRSDVDNPGSVTGCVNVKVEGSAAPLSVRLWDLRQKQPVFEACPT